MQRFEFNDDTSSKFWQIEQSGCELHIAWGKLGSTGQRQTKSFDDAAKAQAAKAKLIAEKTRKGYVPVGGADTVDGADHAPAAANRAAWDSSAARTS